MYHHKSVCYHGIKYEIACNYRFYCAACSNMFNTFRGSCREQGGRGRAGRRARYPGWYYCQHSTATIFSTRTAAPPTTDVVATTILPTTAGSCSLVTDGPENPKLYPDHIPVRPSAIRKRSDRSSYVSTYVSLQLLTSTTCTVRQRRADLFPTTADFGRESTAARCCSDLAQRTQLHGQRDSQWSDDIAILG